MTHALEQAGRTVDEAIAAALERLGLDRDQIEVEVVDEGNRGFLGLGSRDAVVRVVQRQGKADLAVEFLTCLLQEMGYTCAVEMDQDDQLVSLSVDGERAGLLIGRHGQTLDAIQYLLNTIVGRACRDRRRMVVDVEGYRRRRQRSLEALARRMASRARRLGRALALDAMPSHERRIVHLALMEVPGVCTRSEGKEPYRRIIICPEE